MAPEPRGRSPMQLRDAGEEDLPGILGIYNEVIANSTAIYAEEPVSSEDRLASSPARRAQNYPVQVASDASADDLKFLQRARQTHLGTSNRKAAVESYAC